MGAMQNEPSMEEILSSIKRIIAEEDGLSAAPRAPRRASAPAVNGALDDQILELTDALPGESGDESEDGADGAISHEEPIMSAPAKPAPATESPAPSTAGKTESKAAKPEAPKAESKAAPRARAASSANAGESMTPSPAAASAATLVSDEKARAARDSLVNLSRLLISPEDSQPNTVEGLVREMLRPMLKEWLDENLPGMVESMVKREIDRITGRV